MDSQLDWQFAKLSKYFPQALTSSEYVEAGGNFADHYHFDVIASLSPSGSPLRGNVALEVLHAYGKDVTAFHYTPLPGSQFWLELLFEDEAAGYAAEKMWIKTVSDTERAMVAWNKALIESAKASTWL